MTVPTCRVRGDSDGLLGRVTIAPIIHSFVFMGYSLIWLSSIAFFRFRIDLIRSAALRGGVSPIGLS